jgi:hypothetical protein
MQQVYFTPDTRVLRGLDEIGQYLKVHRRTAWRYVQTAALPAMKDLRGTYITTTSLIDLWIISVWSQQVKGKWKAGQAGDCPLPDEDLEEELF